MSVENLHLPMFEEPLVAILKGLIVRVICG